MSMSVRNNNNRSSDNDHDEELSIAELKEKLNYYAVFIDKTLHPDLENAVKAREEIESEIEEYHDLNDQLSIMHARYKIADNDKTDNDANANAPAMAMVDLGHKQCYCQAKLDNPTKVYVHVGMGFHAELSLVEAMQFCAKRIQFLSDHVLPPRQEKAKLIASHLEAALLLVQKLQKEIMDSELSS